MISLYNSLSRQKEIFQPLNPSIVSVYTCGPTVYDYVSIGNWRTYFLGDLLVRTLKYLGYKPVYIMNITDVGHLTGDNFGDSSIGEDRLEKGARRENKTAWDIARFYEKDFLNGYKKLNLTQPKKFTRATNYIKEQIELVQKIERKGFTYKIDDDGIYFSVSSYEKAGNSYGDLSTLDKLKKESRVINKAKKDSRDFALWKFSPKNKKRHMEWDSPWGIGFPGWHIECSAMCLSELGSQIDIHIGGEDLRSTHHPNEIAQSESATGKKPFVRCWLHGAFLQVDGGRMGKSLGNAYTLQDIAKKGYEPTTLRYFYLTSHYRKPLNFTWNALSGAQKSLNRARNIISNFETSQNENVSRRTLDKYQAKFKKILSDDLDMPGILALLWEVLRDKGLEDKIKLKLVKDWDPVLGLGLLVQPKTVQKIDPKIQTLIEQREQLRKQKKYKQADNLRKKLEKKGIMIEDTQNGIKIKTKK